MKILLAVLSLIYLCSCATKEVKVEARHAGEIEIREFRDAENTYRKKNNPLALRKFSIFVQRHPAIDLTNDAYYYIGEIFYEQADYFKAARYWLVVVNSKSSSRYYNRAAVGAAQSQNLLGHTDDALILLSHFEINDSAEPGLAIQALELSAKLKLQKGDHLGAIKDLLRESDFKKNPNDKAILLTRAGEIVNGNLSLDQLQQIANSSEFRGLEIFANYRLATSLYDQKKWSDAHEAFLSVIQKFPGSEQAVRSQQYLNTIDSQEKTDGTTIGVILPLTGKYEQMGYKTLRGIQLGLGVFKKSSASPFKLAIIDSEGDPETAKRGVERLVTEDHVVAIIGDIASKTAQVVSVKCQELGIPNLTLSQKSGLTEIGDFIFRSVLTPESQMKALVDTAMTQRGYKRFAIMYSNDSYGTEYASYFWDYVKLHGGEITAVQTYQPEETDFRDVVQRLVGTFYSEDDRGAELRLRLAEWKKEQALKKLHEKPPKDLLPPIVDFDALFVPDSPKALGQFAPMLAYNDVTKMPLLGTNIWNTPQTLVRGGKFVEGAIFMDDYFADDQSAEMKKFNAEFLTTFNYKPDVFEAHGFDSAALLTKVISTGGYSLSRLALREKLSSVTNVEGATGLLSMSPQRELEKILVPLTVSKGQIVKLQTAAPTNN
jgi:branched-chain amino acid transport system substrate-binding protein